MKNKINSRVLAFFVVVSFLLGLIPLIVNQSNATTITSTYIDNVLTDSSTSIGTRQIVRDNNNNRLYALYQKRVSTIFYNFCAYSTDNGTTWTSVQVQKDPYNCQQSPSIAIDSHGYLYAVWSGNNQLHNGGLDSQIRLSKSTDLGLTWSATINITNVNYDQSAPSITVDRNDKIHIAWYGWDSTASYRDIYYANSTNQGVTWSAIQRLTNDSSPPEGESNSPTLLTDYDNRLLLFYSQIRTPLITSDIMFRSSATNGSTWTTAVNITKTKSAYNQGDPSATVLRDGSIHVIWDRNWGGSTSYAGYSKSTNNGTTWTTPVNLTYENVKCYISSDHSNKLYVVLENYTISGGIKFVMKSINSTDKGATWGTVSNLTTLSKIQKLNFNSIDQTYPMSGGVSWCKPYHGFLGIYASNTTGTPFYLFYGTSDDLRMRYSPTVLTSNATGVTSTNATLHGNLTNNTGYDYAWCRFQYGTTPSFGSTTVSQQKSNFKTTPVSANLTGLVIRDGLLSYTYDGDWTAGGLTTCVRFQVPSNGYIQYNLSSQINCSGIAREANGDGGGADNSIKNISLWNGKTWTVVFTGTWQFGVGGVNLDYRNWTGVYNVSKIRLGIYANSIGSIPALYEVGFYQGRGFIQNINGLTPGTLYYFRAVANNSNGTFYGATKNFTTAIPPTGTFNATKIYDNYASFNATITEDGTGEPNPYITGCNARIQILNLTNYPNWNKATNTTWSGYKQEGQQTYWNNTLLQGNSFTRPRMKFYYRLQLNNTYYLYNYSEKSFMSQPLAPGLICVTPDYDNFTSKLKIFLSSGGQSNWGQKYVVNYKTTGYPTSPSDGTRIYNGTLYPYTGTGKDYKIITNATTYNSKIYVTVWVWASSGNYSKYSNNSYGFATTMKQNFNKVFMNTTTLITSTTARLNVFARSAGLTNYLRGEYGLTTAYGTNTAFTTGVRNGSYTFDLTGLTPGKLYYVRARINNTANTNYSTSPSYFMYNKTGIGTYGSWAGGLLPEYIFSYNTTLSSRCINTTFQPYAGNINIIWTYDHTLYPDASAWKVWSPGDGCSYQMSGNRRELWTVLSSNFTQRIYPTRDAWKYAFLTKPYAPTNMGYTIINSSAVNLTWTKGTGANRTVIVMNNNHQPTSVTDGTIVYNGTGSYYIATIMEGITYYHTAFSFTTWTYNPTLSWFSSNYSYLNWSFIGANCFNESKPSQALVFNIMFKNENGTQVFTAYNVTNTYLLNISNIPIGEDILIKVWREGYKERIIYQTIQNSQFLNLSFYLPPIETQQGDTTADCVTKTAINSINVTYTGKDVNITFSHTPGDIITVERYNSSVDRTLRSFTDSKTVSNHSRDLWIPLTYTKENIISVNIWNDSLYGTYGGWYLVASNKYSYVSGNNTIRINETVLDKNTTIGQVNYYYWGGGTYGAWQFIPETKYTKYSTYLRINKTALDSYITMARVTYYYEYCPSTPTKTILYNIRIVETIKTEFSEFDRPIENARVSIQTYINTSGIYKNITVLLSDSNGYCSAWLIPGSLYQIICTKDGYDRYRAEYQPPPANQYGQVSDKLIRLKRTIVEPAEVNYTEVMDGIHVSLQPYDWQQSDSFTVYFNVTSDTCSLQWFRIVVTYLNYSRGTWTTVGSDNDSTACGGSVSVLIPNATGQYNVRLFIKRVNFTEYEITKSGSIRFQITQIESFFTGIPDVAFYFVLLIIMLFVMGYCVMALGTGLITGYIGLGVMAIGLIFKPITLIAGGIEFSGWAIWGLTFILYSIALFIYSRT